MEGNTDANMNMGTPAPESSTGPVIATVIILAVIILGGLYFWGQRGMTDEPDTTAPAASTTDNTTAAIESQSSLDTTSSIDADLKSTDTTSVDSNLQTL